MNTINDDYDEDSPLSERDQGLAEGLGLVGHFENVRVTGTFRDLETGEEIQVDDVEMMWVPPVGFWEAARMRQRERRQQETDDV